MSRASVKRAGDRRQVGKSQPIQLELDLKLEDVESRIKSILSQRENKWQEIACLALQVREKSSYKPAFKSFTAWVNHIAIQCDRQPSLIWRYIKAARYYLDFLKVRETPPGTDGASSDCVKEPEANKKEPREVKPPPPLLKEQLQGIIAAPEALEMLEKVQRTAPVEVFEKLKERVLSGSATVAQCRQIEREYRASLPPSAQAQAQKTNRGRPRRGQEGSYQHLGAWKSRELTVAKMGECNSPIATSSFGVGAAAPLGLDTSPKVSSSTLMKSDGEVAVGEGEERASPSLTSATAIEEADGSTIANRSQSAVMISRSLTNNLVNWTSNCLRMRYPPKHYKEHTQVRLNYEGQRLRIDFLAVVRWSYKRPKDIFTVEIKSCLSDFQTDEKWEKYLNFCHFFSFAIPAADSDLRKMLLASTPEYVGILGINLEANIQSAISYPVEIIRSPSRLEPSLSHTVYETLYERVLGWSGSVDMAPSQS
jgi:hypothetical protein